MEEGAGSDTPSREGNTPKLELGLHQNVTIIKLRLKIPELEETGEVLLKAASLSCFLNGKLC